MKLMNFSESPRSMERFDHDWEQVKHLMEHHDLDGLEMIFFNMDDAKKVPKGLIKGIHMMYWPDWIDFAEGNHDYLNEHIGAPERVKALYNAENFDDFVKNYQREYQKVCDLGAKYCVFHVGSMRTLEAYSRDFHYSDEVVFDWVIKLVEKAFPYDNQVPIYFENLWGPGLNLKCPEKTKAFYERIPLKQKGIMLDLSHLLITDLDYKNYTGADAYIHKTLDGLGDAISMIKGIHINATFPNDYWFSSSMGDNHQKYLGLDDHIEKYRTISQHISSIDQHIPYESHGLNSIIDRINPEVCVFEVMTNSKEELDDFLRRQNQYVKRL